MKHFVKVFGWLAAFACSASLAAGAAPQQPPMPNPAIQQPPMPPMGAPMPPQGMMPQPPMPPMRDPRMMPPMDPQGMQQPPMPSMDPRMMPPMGAPMPPQGIDQKTFEQRRAEFEARRQAFLRDGGLAAGPRAGRKGWRQVVNRTNHPVQAMIKFDDGSEKSRLMYPGQSMWVHNRAKFLQFKHRNTADQTKVVRVEEKSLTGLPEEAPLEIAPQVNDAAEMPVTAPEVQQAPNQDIPTEAKTSENSAAAPSSETVQSPDAITAPTPVMPQAPASPTPAPSAPMPAPTNVTPAPSTPIQTPTSVPVPAVMPAPAMTTPAAIVPPATATSVPATVPSPAAPSMPTPAANQTTVPNKSTPAAPATKTVAPYAGMTRTR